MVRFRMRPAAFKRLRSKTALLTLDAGDLSGPVLRLLDAVHRRQVQEAYRTHGATVEGGPWRFWTKKYGRWRVRHWDRYGKEFLRLKGSYRGRSPDQLYRKAALAGQAGHVALWRGRLRFAFGFADDVGFMHQHGMGHLPVRSVVDKTRKDEADFPKAFRAFWIKRVKQALR